MGRELILRCSDFCQAAHDAFNNDRNSKYCGSSRYGKSYFFDKVMLHNSSLYQISSFLYATARVNVPESWLLHSHSCESSWDRESNWIGYIATTTGQVSQVLGRREIYITWRGTNRNYEWANVLGAERESIKPLLREEDEDTHELDHKKIPKVMKGWLKIYVSDDPNSPFTKTSARVQLLTKMKELIRERYKNENLTVTFTGHSLGATLSVLSAFDLAENGFSDIPISAFVFGSPQIGNREFRERLKKHKNVNILHIKNKLDFIPHYPGKLMGYVNIGTELVIDTRKSPYLKETKNPGDWHNLQGMLHVVAGWNGEEGEFEMKVKRSLALVNKTSEFLKDEYHVPGSWCVEKNKGMVVDENGYWVLASPDEDDIPVPEY